MEPEQIKIDGEYVALFEVMDNTVDMDAFWNWLRRRARGRGVKVREWGDENSMRQSLVERAEFISRHFVEE